MAGEVEVFEDLDGERDGCVRGGGRGVCRWLQNASGGLEFVLSRDEADFDALSYGIGNTAEHLEGMAGVVGVLEPADDGFGCANHPGEARLGEAGFFAQLVDFSGKLVLRACFF